MNSQLHRSTQAACLIDRDLPLLAERLDGFEGHGVVSTYAPRLRPHRPWRSQVMEEWPLVSATFDSQRQLRCLLSREGQVNIYGPGGTPDHTFQIPEAGVFGPASTGLGYVNRIRAVGSGLYVCGQSRQVYRFDWDGQDLARGRWVDVAGAMRQPPASEPPAEDDAEAFEAWLDANESADFHDIDGPAENDLYAVGDEVWHWDGQRWAPLALPTDEPLAAITVLGADDVVMVGHNGTLLRGNAGSGFKDLSGVHDNQNFTGVAALGERLYLASNLGLFVYEAGTGIRPCRTGLQPELQDAHQLEAKDGVLWSFGFKDLAWFDGQRWTRVDHPDNPPIR
jgi:hypothetical protein